MSRDGLTKQLVLAIVIDAPGPVLFTQKRLGKNKRYFKVHNVFKIDRDIDFCNKVPRNATKTPDNPNVLLKSHKRRTVSFKNVQNIIGAPRGDSFIPPENPVMKCKVTFCLKETVWEK